MTNIYKAPDSDPRKEASIGQYGSLEKGIAGDYELSVGQVLSEAWARTSGRKGKFIGAFFMYMIVMVCIMLVMQAITMELIVPNVDKSLLPSLGLVQQLIINLVMLPIGVGLFMLGLRASVDADLYVTSIFDYFAKALSLLATLILMYLLVAVGLVLLILPGVYLIFAYYLAMPLVVEKGLSPWQALEASRKAITHRWFTVFGLMIVLMLITMISMIPLGIGMIWSMPMMMIAYGLLYRNIFGVEPENAR